MTSLSFQPKDPGAAAPTEGAPAPAAQTQQPDPGAGGGGMFGGLGGMLFLLLPILLIFWMTRSQNKKQKELEENLKVGDRVITRAGMIGKITKLGERTAEIELAPGVNVPFLKSAIEGKDVDPKKDAKKTDEKAAEEDPKGSKVRGKEKQKASSEEASGGAS